jgi:hypothetical protein
MTSSATLVSRCWVSGNGDAWLMPLVEKIDGTLIRPCDVGRSVRYADDGSKKRGAKPGELPRRPEHPITREPLTKANPPAHDVFEALPKASCHRLSPLIVDKNSLVLLARPNVWLSRVCCSGRHGRCQPDAVHPLSRSALNYSAWSWPSLYRQLTAPNGISFRPGR